jgi:predicted dehydrogenase
MLEMHAYRQTETSNSRLEVVNAQFKPVTVALIGCGAVSQHQYAGSLDTLANEGLAETVAIVDPRPQQLTRLLGFLPAARPYADLKEMLQQTKPELAIVAAPHRFHEDLTLECLNRGTHILCEKPMALTTAECDRMIKTAQTAERQLAVGHFRRFYSSCEAVREILESRCLGQVKAFRFLEGYHYNWPITSASFFDRREAGGGVLIDTGAHALDLLLWWLGDVDEVYYQDDAMGGIEANCQIQLRMASGVKGIVRLSRDWPLPNSCVFDCEKGWLEYSCDVTDRIKWGLYGASYSMKAELHKDYNDSFRIGESVFVAKPSTQPLDYFTAQLRNVVGAIRGKDSLRVPGTEARKVIALIETCYESRELLPMAWLEDREAQRATSLANA